MSTNYIEHELMQVCPLPLGHAENGQIKMQLTSDAGRTKWLNLTNEQFRQLEQIMLAD